MAHDLVHAYNRKSLTYCAGIISNDCRLIRFNILVGQMGTIDVLPDEVLLAIFDFSVFKYEILDSREFDEYDIERKIEWWQSLVRVCRRWRCLVFGSPRRLNLQLQLYYDYELPTRTVTRTLDVWPTLPLLIWGDVTDRSGDDVIAGLGHRDRICQINLRCSKSSNFEKLWTGMQVPFPELEILRLSVGGSTAPRLPDSFLGGSAPRLRSLTLDSIPFPGLPKLLLSATHLVKLSLYVGYISPGAMVTCLSVLTRLEELYFQFKFLRPSSDQESRRPPPLTRSVLPALKDFSFQGVSEYLEKFVTQIDTPRLSYLSTEFFNDIDFDTTGLNQFISRTATLGAFDEASLIFYNDGAQVLLRQSQHQPSDGRTVNVVISSDRQPSTLAQICTLSLRHLLLTMENLYIFSPLLRNRIDNTEWLDLFLPFTAVKNLYLSGTSSSPIALALQELTRGRTKEVFPALQNILLEEGFQPSEPVQKAIEGFISARQLAGHPVAISVWDIFSSLGS